MQMKREEGWRKGFFKGNGTNVIRIAPYSAVQFASFEIYKSVRTIIVITNSVTIIILRY